jgi:preprotein translocase subunit Sss1
MNLIEAPPETEQWQAITDRILRVTRKPSKE